MADDPTCLLLQVREELRTESAGVARTRVDVRVVGGKDASHSLHLLLNKPVAIVGREQVVFLIAVIDIEVLDAHVQQLELGALTLVVRSIPMVAFDVLLRTAQRAALALVEGQSLAIRIAHTLQSWWGYVVSEHVHGLNHRLGIVVDSLCRVI